MLRPFTDHAAAVHEDLLVGVAHGDDAGVFRIGEGRALVQTVDFFSPIVDDPYDWGRIAAANALSDVYAMGGRPLTSLQLVGWPRAKLPLDLLGRVLAGGADVMAEAGAVVAGGHSIDNESPVYGFSVTGLVDPRRMTVNSAARPGDAVVLTKPLGTGVAAAAVKQGAASPALAGRAVEVMAALNKAASEVMTEAGVRAAVDVTGFGLLGHLREMLEASGVSARLDMASVPVLDGVAGLVEAGVYPGGSMRNLRSAAPFVEGRAGDTALKILSDAQTSGGLLMAAPPPALEGLVAGLAGAAPAAAVIGEFTEAGGAPKIEVS